MSNTQSMPIITEMHVISVAGYTGWQFDLNARPLAADFQRG